MATLEYSFNSYFKLVKEYAEAENNLVIPISARIEEELSLIASDYSDNFDEDKEAQIQFIFDVLDVLRYICGEW